MQTLRFEMKCGIETHQEGDVWVAMCPSLDGGSQGDTRDEAVEMLREAANLFLEDCLERGTLRRGRGDGTHQACPADRRNVARAILRTTG